MSYSSCYAISDFGRSLKGIFMQSVTVTRALATLGIFIFSFCTLSQEPYKTVSPNGIYTVQFQERPRGWPSMTHYDIYISCFRDGQPLIEDIVLIGPGTFNRKRFRDKYQDVSWESDNILRLGGKDRLPQSQCDVYLISNNTNKVVSYLRVNGKWDERFIVFDLQPQSVIKLYPQPQTDQDADLSWVGAEVRFADGGKAYGGADFQIRDLYKGPAHYCLSIKEKQILIMSREFEGFTIDMAHLEKNKDDILRKLDEATDDGARKRALSEIRSLGVPKTEECQIQK